jgi:hypothetical protein
VFHVLAFALLDSQVKPGRFEQTRELFYCSRDCSPKYKGVLRQLIGELGPKNIKKSVDVDLRLMPNGRQHCNEIVIFDS